MAKTQGIALTVGIGIVAAIAVYFIYKTLKSTTDVISGAEKGFGDATRTLTDSFNTFWTDLGNTGKGFENWMNGFYNQYLNKPIIPVPPAITRSGIDTIVKGGGSGSTTNTKGNPSEGTSGNDPVVNVTKKQTIDQQTQAGQNTTPNDAKINVQVTQNNYSKVDPVTQNKIDAYVLAKTQYPNNSNGNPTTNSQRSIILATSTNTPINDNSGRLKSPIAPEKGTIFDQAVASLSGIFASIAVVNPIARPVSPVIEVGY